MANLMFEVFSSPGVFFAPQCILPSVLYPLVGPMPMSTLHISAADTCRHIRQFLSLIASQYLYNLPTCVCVEIGEGLSQAVCIYQGAFSCTSAPLTQKSAEGKN
jgi:hypothetical protein